MKDYTATKFVNVPSQYWASFEIYSKLDDEYIG